VFETPEHQGMGPTMRADGVEFRVWAPHAKQVAVVGSFNNWDGLTHPMQSDEKGNWHVEVQGAKIGDQYKYQLTTEAGVMSRIDPYAREVTSSVGNASWRPSEWCKSTGPHPGVAGLSVRTSGDRLHG
jgi:1,4-alpha-glucan branching enzyme